MMNPKEIATQGFSQNGKGGYKAEEVRAFLQRVYQSYSKVYNERLEYIDKLSAITAELNEYHKSKSTIADALIWAKSTAEKNIEEATAIADNLVAEATVKSEKLLEEKRMQADAYYSEKTATANKNVEKAKAELESIKQQSEIYADRYMAEINVKAQTVIEDANSKAAAIVAEARAEARKEREKSEKIIYDANSELVKLKSEAAKIKGEILALIAHAETAASKIDDSVFAHFDADESTIDEEVAAKEIDFDELDKFTFEGIQPVIEEVVEETPEEKEQPSAFQTAGVQPGYVRFFGADIPDVNDIISEIFSAAGSSSGNSEDENSFRFEKIVSDFDMPAEREPFSFLKDDRE